MCRGKIQSLLVCRSKKKFEKHYPTLQENKPTGSTPFVSVIQHLKTEFLSRFGDIRSLENDIKLFSTPFDVQVDTVQEKHQMEIVELQCSDELKSKFHNEGVLLLDFYKKYLECKQYPNLINHAKKICLAALMCANSCFRLWKSPRASWERNLMMATCKIFFFLPLPI